MDCNHPDHEAVGLRPLPVGCEEREMRMQGPQQHHIFLDHTAMLPAMVTMDWTSGTLMALHPGYCNPLQEVLANACIFRYSPYICR
ncbi:hypothetical protein H671_3g9180 [Cricetulus griseus]|uniref:Uncharacterized protein n=1 Tax=Cricetulus griseus TaxID=10029 RepID=A0A061IEB6_CRIGR|nr:hypothetical protein H671_3g9180 [Cricetulus griseus]